jgi:hypothetical protein
MTLQTKLLMIIHTDKINAKKQDNLFSQQNLKFYSNLLLLNLQKKKSPHHILFSNQIIFFLKKY